MKEHPLRNNSFQIAERITINPEQCSGRLCIRGMRIRVIDVLELLAAGFCSSTLLALGFSCSQAESTPAHT